MHAPDQDAIIDTRKDATVAAKMREGAAFSRDCRVSNVGRVLVGMLGQQLLRFHGP